MHTSNQACFKHKPKYNVKLIRISLGLTIKETAAQMGISSSTLSRYEKNPEMMPVSLAKSLLEYYSFPIDDCSFT